MRHPFHIFLAVSMMLSMMLLSSCANIGSPEGGPRDYNPPELVRTNPEYGAVNFRGNKVEIVFDEIVQLAEQQKKVFVSPAQKNPPTVKVLGKKITVEFRDSLKPNTTYVIDFTNAIEDNNEGNMIKDYSFAFSTGEAVDTMCISGIVLRAADLEPMQSVLVGVHSNMSDTAFSTLPLERITRTNDRGQFTLRNLPMGQYRVFALNDMDGNYLMSRSEDYAFVDSVYTTSTGTYTSMDTTFTYDHRVDTIKQVEHTIFYPNDVLLCMFNENYRAHYLKKNERLDARRLFIQLAAPEPDLPPVQLIKPARYDNDWYVLERTARNDSLIYWITDTNLVKTDSLTLAVTYRRSDKDDSIELKTDTLNFVTRRSNAAVKEAEKLKKEREKNEKELAKLLIRREKLEDTDKKEELEDVDQQIKDLRDELTVKPERIGLSINNTTLEIDDSLFFKADVPIAAINRERIKVQMFNSADSVWRDVDIPAFQPADSLALMRYTLPYKFTPDSAYRFSLDVGAVTSIYGLTNDSTGVNFKVRNETEYANLFLRVSGVSGKAFAQLLTSGDQPVAQADYLGGEVVFEHVKPGTYYVRLILDNNDNRRWDTGNYAQNLQPEEVYYYPKKITLRKNWDLDVAWNIYATAVDLQKPEEIRKNKPEKRKDIFNQAKSKTGDNEDEEEADDEFNSSGFGNNANYSGNKYRDTKRR